jgi:hypothetical protein
MSLPPPGVNGTTMRTGLAGYSCADTAGTARTFAAMAKPRTQRDMCMKLLLKRGMGTADECGIETDGLRRAIHSTD